MYKESGSTDRRSGRERILCFRRNLLSEYSTLNKRIFHDEKLWSHILRNLEILPRSEAEEKYDCKQLVVYVLVKADDLYLTYKRTRRSLEERLRYKHSIGIGGHVNIGDRNQVELAHENASHQMKMDFLVRGVWRELKEEVLVESKITQNPRLLCFVNDDSNAVGLKHFGIVFLVEIDRPSVVRKGTGIGSLEFRSLKDLKRNQSDFERWSQLLIDFLAKESA